MERIHWARTYRCRRSEAGELVLTMNRRTNTRNWRNVHTGDIYQTYEEWGLLPIGKIARSRVLHARDQMSGINAPSGYLWVKTVEVNPPDGGGWVEVN